VFSSANKHRNSNQSHQKSGWGSSRWPATRQPQDNAPPQTARPGEGSVFESSWELSHGCEVAELDHVPTDWGKLTG
jgi:hypothetical protein